MKYLLKFLLISMMYNFCPNILYSQIGNNQVPLSVDWRCISNENFEIFFPYEIEKDAQRIMNILEHINPNVYKTMENKPKKVSLVLQNQTAVSNGFVSMIPRKMEFFTTPPQDIFTGINDWYNLLCIHEYRHVIQFDKINKRFNGLASSVFGSFIEQGLEGFSIPNWFYEGDATLMETLLSNSGRGRLPLFDVELRALLLAGKKYSYDKAIFGSFKDWTPLESPYLLGYYLNTYIRRKYGEQVFPNTLHRTSLLPFVPYMFSLALNAETGNGIYSNFDNTINEIDSLFKNQVDRLNISPAKTINHTDTETWTYNYAPQYYSDNNIFIFRTGLDDIGKFILLNRNTKEEIEFFRPGRINYERPATNGKSIVWSEDFSDPRWAKKTCSDIKIFNAGNQKVKRLTSGGRYFSPAISPDEKTVVAFEYSEESKSALVFINSENGNIISKKETEFIYTPSFSTDGRNLVYCKKNMKGDIALCKLSLTDTTEEVIIPFSERVIFNPAMGNRYIYFTAAYSGIDNIYAIDITGKRIFQVTFEKSGAYFPSLSANNKNLLFNTINEYGAQVAEIELDPDKWVPIEEVRDKSINYYKPLIAQEYGKSILDSIPNKHYDVRNYNSFTDLFNFHSWLPDININNKNAFLSLYSTNILNTLQTNIGYIYNWEERSNLISLGFNYAALYPIINLSLNYGNRSEKYSLKNGNTDFYTWKEKSFNLGAYIPLDLTNDNYSTSLSFGINTEYIFLSDISDARYFKNLGSFASFSYYTRFFRGYKGIKDLMPVYGQSLDILFAHSPFNTDYKTDFFSISGNLYFPGFFKHHGFLLNAGYEHQTYDGYKYSSRIQFTRGYSSIYYTDIGKTGITYALPLFYPDFNIFHLIYIKRVSMNTFYDYLTGQNDEFKHLYRSFGAELTARIGLLSNSNITANISIRYSYQVDKKNNNIELLMGLY